MSRTSGISLTRAGAVLAAAVTLAAALPAAAQSTKIGVVDLQRALITSKEGKATKAKLESDVNRAQSELDQKSNELKKLKDDLDKQKLTLKDDALGDKQRELESKQREAVRYRSDVLDELKRKEGEATQRILKQLADIVEKIGKEDGYNLVFEQHNMLFADPSYDITDKLIQRFDAEGVRPPAPGEGKAKP